MSRTIRDRGHYRWMHGSDVEYINRQLDMTNRWVLMSVKYDRRPYTTYCDKYIKDDETIIRESKEQLKRWTRDGRDGLTSSNANTGFKTDAKKIVRRANKSFCRAVLSGDDYENIPYATDKLGKDFIYRWW